MLLVTWVGGLISSLYGLPILDRPLCVISALKGSRRRRRKMSTRESRVTDPNKFSAILPLPFLYTL